MAPRTTRLKKKGKTLKRLKIELWGHCKRIIRAKYGNTCYTCGKTGLEGSSWHTGHFLPSSSCGGYLRYNLRNLRPQCYYCNINLGGNGAAYYRNLAEREGQPYVEQLFKDKQRVIKLDCAYLQSLIDEYAMM